MPAPTRIASPVTALATAVTVLVTVLTCAGPAPAAPVAPRHAVAGAVSHTAQACGDALIVGVRGSGQTENDYGGWGREMAGLRDALKSRTTHLDLDTEKIGYPAAPVETLEPTLAQIAGLLAGSPLVKAAAIAAWAGTKLAKYVASIRSGVHRLRATIADASTACPQRPLVLTGYSQGAMVVHRTLVGLAKDGERKQLKHVAAVGLLADGDRTAGSAQHNLGSASDDARGIAVFGLLSNTDTPRKIADRTYSYCDDNDVVCDATAGNVIHYARGFRIHGAYDADAFNAIAKRLASHLPAPVDYGAETGRIDFNHPTWGPSTLITSMKTNQYGWGEGFIHIVDAAGRITWSHRTGHDFGWWEMELNDPATDATGQIFISWNPGRYDGITVLQPVSGGMEDHDTLPPENEYDTRFYYAETEDVNSDGTLEVISYDNDCIPDCAGGTITSETWWWNGSDYVLPD